MNSREKAFSLKEEIIFISTCSTASKSQIIDNCKWYILQGKVEILPRQEVFTLGSLS